MALRRSGSQQSYHGGVRNINCTTLAVKLLALAAATTPLAGVAHAGTFQLASSGWTAFTGSSSLDPSLYTTQASEVGATIKLSAPSVYQSGTVSGTWSFTVTWTPATGDTVPANAVVRFGRLSTLTVAGDGTASISNNLVTLDSMDSSDLFLSGYSTVLNDVVLTLPLIQQSDGTYVATGNITTDTLSVTFNTQSSAVTTCEESIDLIGIAGGN